MIKITGSKCVLSYQPFLFLSIGGGSGRGGGGSLLQNIADNLQLFIKNGKL